MNPSFHFRPNRQSAGGFSLVEMLVALAVSLVLLTLVASVVSNSASVTLTIHNRLAAYHDANMAFDYLAQDFGSLVPSSLTQNTLSIVPDQVAGSTGGTASSMWIVLLGRPASARQSNNVYLNQGVMSAISYRVAYQDPISPTDPAPSKSFALYRSVVTTTPSNFLNQTPGTTWDLYANFWMNYWGTYSAGGNTPLDDYLLGDVVGIQVNLNYSYIPAPTDATPTPGATLISVPVTSGTGEVALTPSGFTGNITSSGANIPLSVNITMTLLRAHGATLYQKGAWSLQKAILQDGIVISRNIPIGTCSVD